MTTTADLLIQRLIDWGVDTVFGFPGDGVNDIFEALRTHQDRLRFIQVRHEEAAAFAACGYAKFSGRLAACIATSGPGGIHLLNGLYDAKLDGQPVLAITGHTFHDLIGTHYQQDVDLDKLFMDVAAYNERVMGPHHVVSVVDEAMKTALSRRTVSHITIPKDTQGFSMGDEPISSADVPGHSGDIFAPRSGLPSPEQVRRAAELINQGEKVAILAGRGALAARAEVLALADAAAAPIVKPLLGKGVVPDDSPLTTGGIGLLGTAPSYEVMSDADTLVILGSGFPYMEFYPKPGQARTVQVDSNPDRIGLRHPVEVGLVGDCREVLQALLPLVQHKTKRDFLQQAQSNMQDWRKLVAERGTRGGTPMKPQVVAYQLNKLLADDTLIACDTGTVTTWAARQLELRGEMQFTASGMLATMACALPYAVGGAIAFPNRPVLAVVGDGGYTMLMGELATIAKYQLPVKIVVFKNNVLGQIKWEQIVFEGTPQFGVELQPIDFEQVARGFGVPAFTLEDPAQAEETTRRFMQTPGAALLQAVVDPNEPPYPGNITTRQALNFAEAMLRGEPDRWEIIKTVVGDKVREVV